MTDGLSSLISLVVNHVRTLWPILKPFASSKCKGRSISRIIKFLNCMVFAINRCRLTRFNRSTMVSLPLRISNLHPCSPFYMEDEKELKKTKKTFLDMKYLERGWIPSTKSLMIIIILINHNPNTNSRN